ASRGGTGRYGARNIRTGKWDRRFAAFPTRPCCPVRAVRARVRCPGRPSGRPMADSRLSAIFAFWRRGGCTSDARPRGDHIATDDARINDRIRAREVLLIGPEGEQLGVKPLPEALAIAREEDLDLVEVAPNANPPVARIMD